MREVLLSGYFSFLKCDAVAPPKAWLFLMNYLSFVYVMIVIIVVVNYFNTQTSVAADFMTVDASLW